ncbi:MAG: DPP IV N-terminal domain-containing protein, partial [Bryobacteraceae bacterium]
AIRIEAAGLEWTCTLAEYECRPGEKAAARNLRAMEVRSPDGKWIAYQKNYNLYVRSTTSQEEIRLSHDGAARHDYSATLPPLPAMIRDASMEVTPPPSARWSPDSKRLLAYRVDRRSAREFTVVQSVPKNGLRPLHYTYPYPLPGEIGLSRAEPVVFDIASRRQIDVKTEPLDLLYTGGPNLRWFADSRRGYFVYTRRGYQNVQLREIDAATGDVRVLVDERSETFIDPGMTYYRVLEESAEIVWSSERDGWCHLYLYDGKSGRLKHAITKGPWVVRDILRVDEKSRRVWFAASGREAGRDPYLVHVYRTSLDGGDPVLLTPEDAEHSVSFSPAGAFFVDTWSKVNTAP